MLKFKTNTSCSTRIHFTQKKTKLIHDDDAHELNKALVRNILNNKSQFIFWPKTSGLYTSLTVHFFDFFFALQIRIKISNRKEIKRKTRTQKLYKTYSGAATVVATAGVATSAPSPCANTDQMCDMRVWKLGYSNKSHPH